MDNIDKLLINYDPIDYKYANYYEKIFIPTEDGGYKKIFCSHSFDDGLSGEAQAEYFSRLRRNMGSFVFQSVVRVGQNNKDFKILEWLRKM